MIAPKPKIAFLKQGAFSHINHNIEKVLRTRFSECDLDVIDIKDLLGRYPNIMTANIPWFIREYGVSFNDSLAQHRKNFYRTTYLFRRLRELINEIICPDDYLFSFQTQSLFDLSTPNVPHFVYTDHAILSNLAYPHVTQAYIDAHYPAELIALEKTIYQNATMIFTMGNFVAQTLVEEYDCAPNSVACVGGGSNLPETVESLMPSAVARPDYDAKNILFLGVVWTRKGGPELVAAFEKLRKRHPTATLTIVGCTPNIDVAGCKVIGPVPLAEVQTYYKSASIFCMPSRREPFGLAYIEAFMHRLPVVATTIGAIPDIVRHTESGLLVEPSDETGLVHALDTLLNDPGLCQEFGEIGYNFVRTKYTWNVVGDALAHYINLAL